MKATTECCEPDEFGVFVPNGIVFCKVNGVNGISGGQQLRDEVVAALNAPIEIDLSAVTIDATGIAEDVARMLLMPCEFGCRRTLRECMNETCESRQNARVAQLGRATGS